MNNLFLQSLRWISFLCLFSLTSCKKKEANYILYYQKANDIDSIYRMAGKPKLAVEEYKKLFEEYEPRNQERLREYETYIILADRFNIDFGGKRSLKKLILLKAERGGNCKEYYPLLKKYGIDSLDVKKQILDWKENLNQTLIDSFTVAMRRDREGRRPLDTAMAQRNVMKNAKLLLWTFKKYGYPTSRKMGTMGPNDTFFAMTTFLTHMNEAKEYYPQIKTKLYEYVKSGDCVPRDYTLMVDNIAFLEDKEGIYRFNPNVSKDSAKINRNRKSIGLPSIKHTNLIIADSSKPIWELLKNVKE
ncbi:hypothetical protein HHL23_14415 [Chryseobacterium sp. RP-3-3]|uniref:Uncharacterized protein n=1 Tax=Chryseobacterium antibioticum TaxID=2728847 RepID=A0A7Y0FSP0_9FLAO|nr:hypothetical protein [Chryseobacterium antibioticum]NML70980.1 hypothetical protein [Chryseobacterium antibioticum]